MAEGKEFIPPRSITIDNFNYSFKDKLINSFSYGCQHRRKCNILLKITKEELKQYVENNNHKIKYTITSTLKEHICIKKESSENIEHNKLNINKHDNIEFINSLIFANIEKPFLFHKTNLRNNNIYLKPNQIKWLLQKLREAKFPSDNKYLEDITKINITFDEYSDLKDIPFCYKYVNFINPTKKNANEKYLIF